MTAILRANLKHIYQRWAMLLVFLFLGFIVACGMTVVILNSKPGGIPIIALAVFFFGIFIATLPIGVLTKPFSYCLPAHRSIPVKFLFCTGLVICFLFSLLFLLQPDVDIVKAMVCVPAFFTFTIVYWLGVWTVFRFRSWSATIGFIGFVPLLAMWTDVHIYIERFILGNIPLVVLLACVANFLAYKLLSADGLARRYCGKMWMGTFDAWNKDKIVKFKQLNLAEKEEKKDDRTEYQSSKIEDYLLTKISNPDTGNLARHIFSGIYRSSAAMLSRRNEWLKSLILWPPLVCFMGYIGVGINFLYIIPAFMVIHMSLHVHSTMLISGGRRERFYTAITLALATSLALVAILAILTAMSLVLAPIMPDMTLTGKPEAFHPLNITLLWIPMVLIPIAFAISHLFPKQTLLSRLLPMMIFIGIFQFLVIMSAAKHPVTVIPLVIALIVIASWAALIAVLHFTCTRRCLTK